MAGTRLLIHTTFLVEIVLLTALAVHLGSRHPISPSQKAGPSLFVDRRGLAVPHGDVASRISELEDRANGLALPRALPPSSSDPPAALSREVSSIEGVGSVITTVAACHITVTAVDEDPSSHSPTPASSFSSTTSSSPRTHHDELGTALDAVVDSTIRPMLLKLSPVTDFSISTRTVAYGTLSSGALLNDSTFVVPVGGAASFWSDHGGVISAPRRFGARGGGGCHLDLVLYVPCKDRMPLLLIEGGGATARVGTGGSTAAASSAFALPGDGGAVSIVNLPGGRGGENIASAGYAAAVADAMSHLASYVRRTVGLSPIAVAVEQQADNGGIADWEVDMLRRKVWNARFTKVILDVRAIWELAVETRVAVPIETGKKIDECLDHVQKALDLAQNSQTSDAMMSEITVAILAADAVKADGSMTEQLHFPRDHYLAVFTPLLLPLFMPLVIGLGREVKRYKKLRSGEEVK